jgi:hypothetical protein
MTKVISKKKNLSVALKHVFVLDAPGLNKTFSWKLKKYQKRKFIRELGIKFSERFKLDFFQLFGNLDHYKPNKRLK